MKMGSLFSGIGGFDLGFQRAGIETVWQVERDKFCLRILEKNFPGAKRFTDVRKVGKRNLAPVDVITAGVPCQDVSIAGRREGLAGERTGLFYEFARILRELRPAWFVFENVPGLFSSNEGRDFAEILRVLMVECGYGISWRVLDSRYFHVAQRRERVFIVGSLGRPCPAQILFEPASGARNSAESGAPREDIAVPLTSGSGIAGPAGRRHEDDYNIVRQAISSKWSKGSSGPAGDEHHNLVLGRNPAELVAPLNTQNGHCINAEDAAGNHIVTHPLTAIHGNTEDGTGRGTPLVAATIRAEYSEKSYRGDGCDNFVLDNAHEQREGLQGLRGGSGPAAPDGTVVRKSRWGRDPVSVAENQRGEIRTSSIAPQLSTGGGKPGSGYSAVAYALREDPGGTGQGHNTNYVCGAITPVRGGADDNDAQGNFLVSHAGAQERTVQLRGDTGGNAEHHGAADHERQAADAHGVRNAARFPKGLDSPRYRALGNAVTASVAEWIAQRLKEVS